MTIKEALLATICYADVFDYPLTLEEVEKWLIGIRGKQVRSGQASKRKMLQDISGITSKDGYIFLRGRTRILTLRKQRAVWAGPKVQLAKHAAALLKIIPTIKLIGVTGGLAMDNAHEHDDIDFYIATCRKTIWVTRFLATVLLEIYKLRRKPQDTEFQNKICLNMYVDEDHLGVVLKERDLFSAHEVLQLKPLWERDNTYEKFLNHNRWVKKYLPNAWGVKVESRKSKVESRKSWMHSVLFSICHVTCMILEPVFRWFQLWYMQKRRSSEVVSDTLIRFHPHDARVWVKAKYAMRLGKYNIPLDKIFFGR